jgi:apolipoprotein N-acyltransferase
MNSFFLSILSALVLGFAQVFYMPWLFGEVEPYQKYLGLLAFIGYAPLFLLLDNKPLKQAFGWAFFSLSVQYTIILYWLYIPLNVYGHLSPFLSGLIALLIPLSLALMGSVFLTIGHFIRDRYAISFFLIAPIALCAGEYFRNFYVFGGFPWGNVGYAISQIDEFLQAASIVGISGVVFLVGVINALLAFYIKCYWVCGTVLAMCAFIMLTMSWHLTYG